jgi:hypothetical protein
MKKVFILLMVFGFLLHPVIIIRTEKGPNNREKDDYGKTEIRRQVMKIWATGVGQKRKRTLLLQDCIGSFEAGRKRLLTRSAPAYCVNWKENILRTRKPMQKVGKLQ